MRHSQIQASNLPDTRFDRDPYVILRFGRQRI